MVKDNDDKIAYEFFLDKINAQTAIMSRNFFLERHLMASALLICFNKHRGLHSRFTCARIKSRKASSQWLGIECTPLDMRLADEGDL